MYTKQVDFDIMYPENKKMVKSLYNTYINETKAVGYCWKHHAYITAKQMRTKKCLSYGCDALERKDHPVWIEREVKKANKKARKMANVKS